MRTVAEVVAATGGKWIRKGPESFEGVSTDTRKELTGKMFIALRGDAFDAHDFLSQAAEKNPNVLLIDDQEKLAETKNISVVLVADTLLALQDYAKFLRNTSKSKYIGITGSNGKTTTKRFTQQLIGEGSFCSKGSFNNHWGVPFTLIDADHDFSTVIVEMGMNHSGEIQRLCEIANPQIRCVTTVGRAHLENFHNMEDLAKAKEEIYSDGGEVGVFNIDNPWTQKMLDSQKDNFDRVFTFSTQSPDADVYLSLEASPQSGLCVRGTICGVSGSQQLNLLGEHNISNLAAAAANAVACGGVEPEMIWTNMKNCQLEWGRLQLVESAAGAEILFDAYNANPDSMGEFVKVLGSITTKKLFVVVGNMLELGPSSPQHHSELAEKLNQLDLAGVYLVGSGCKIMQPLLKAESLYSEKADRKKLDQLVGKLDSGKLIAVKGGRGAELETLFREIPQIANKY